MAKNDDWMEKDFIHAKEPEEKPGNGDGPSYGEVKHFDAEGNLIKITSVKKLMKKADKRWADSSQALSGKNSNFSGNTSQTDDPDFENNEGDEEDEEDKEVKEKKTGKPRGAGITMGRGPIPKKTKEFLDRTYGKQEYDY